MRVIHPIPNEIRNMMTDPSIRLSSLSRYLNPGAEGAAFYSYSMKFIKRLESVKIINFVDLKSENEKVEAKVSNLSKSLRIIVQGQYEFFVREYEDSLRFWKSLTDEQRESVTGSYYIEETESIMKLNLIKINQDIASSGESLVSKDALSADMQVIYDHYKNESNNIPADLVNVINDYDTIRFGSVYLSKLLGLKLELSEEGQNIRIKSI